MTMQPIFADHIITATALSLGAQLVTKDEKLNMQTVW